jgi:hypothetical protein
MPIGSHVIPRFYLEQFASEPARKGKPGRVWVYQRGKKPQQRATSVQGRENGYFGFVRPDGTLEESLETRLAKLEKACHDTLVCAKSELFCWSSAHRNNLAFYTSLLFQRATQSRNVNIKHWDGIQKGFAEALADDEFIDDLAVHYSAKFNKEIRREELREMLRGTLKKLQRPSEAKNTYLEKLLWQTEYIRDILLGKPWQIWRAPSGAEFVTSDNPLITFVRLRGDVLHPGYGFRRPGVVAAFPLAPECCLAMGPHGPESVTFGHKHVMMINELTIRLSDKFVYSRTRSEEIKNLVDEQGGTAKYGDSAFLLGGAEMPSIKTFLRHHLGISPEGA